MEISGIADAGITTVAPESDSHYLTGTDEAHCATDSAKYCEVCHNIVRSSKCNSPANVRNMRRKWNSGTFSKLSHFFKGSDRIFVVADIVGFDFT